MVRFDASESLTPFRVAGGGYGSILCDAAIARQVGHEWFDPRHWGDAAQPVGSGGRGGAWFVDGQFGHAVLRHYLRGGLAARISRDLHLWRGRGRAPRFVEVRLPRGRPRGGPPVPPPGAASHPRR